MIKDRDLPGQEQESTQISYDNNGFSTIKCFADTECNESPSSGWKFVKYCMRA